MMEILTLAVLSTDPETKTSLSAPREMVITSPSWPTNSVILKPFSTSQSILEAKEITSNEGERYELSNSHFGVRRRGNEFVIIDEPGAGEKSFESQKFPPDDSGRRCLPPLQVEYGALIVHPARGYKVTRWWQTTSHSPTGLQRDHLYLIPCPCVPNDQFRVKGSRNSIPFSLRMTIYFEYNL